MSGFPRVLNIFPPNFREINAAFKTRDRAIFYAYGGVIYNPKGVKIPPALIAHERVHLSRQGGDPAAWWRRYIAEPAFRLDEEIEAHIAEYRHICSALVDVPGRDKVLLRVAERLASPLYGSLIGIDEAKERIAYAGEGASRSAVSPTA